MFGRTREKRLKRDEKKSNEKPKGKKKKKSEISVNYDRRESTLSAA